MSMECDIHFNTSRWNKFFRNILSSDSIPTFLSEGFCELYEAATLRDYVVTLEGTEVQFVKNDKFVSVDSYGKPIKMYLLTDIISLIEKCYSQYLANSESGLQSKSSLTVCLGILKAILANSCQTENELVVMLYFH